MSKIPKFRLRIFLKNFSNNKFDLIKNKLIENDYIDFIEVSSVEKYWKNPDETECYFDIYTKDEICLKQILKFYDVNWKYSSPGEVFFDKDGVNCIFNEEFAYYVKDRFPDNFIHKDISLAHFYNFPIDPNVCENEELE